MRSYLRSWGTCLAVIIPVWVLGRQFRHRMVLVVSAAATFCSRHRCWTCLGLRTTSSCPSCWRETRSPWHRRRHRHMALLLSWHCRGMPPSASPPPRRLPPLPPRISPTLAVPPYLELSPPSDRWRTTLLRCLVRATSPSCRRAPREWIPWSGVIVSRRRLSSNSSSSWLLLTLA